MGWTLAHSLWEGALVALVLWGALGWLGSSRARYAAACLAMLAMLGGFGVTFQHVLAEQGIQGVVGQRLTIGPAPSDLGDGTIVANVAPRFRAVEYLPWLAPFWIAGVMFFQLRCVASWLAARRLGRRGVCAATAYWQNRLHRLAAQVRVSAPVTLLESCLAEVPVVVGYVRPVILMPVGLMTGLPMAQLESILLHELAHIRRHDYLVNLFQIVLEGLVFYHPAVWWISGVIRAERENCCDDLVVATQGDALAYAAALTALEDHRGAVREAVLAATGGSIVKRVRRLLVPAEGPRAALTPVLSAAVLTVTVVAAMAAWQTSAPPRPPAPPAPPVPPAAVAPFSPPAIPAPPRLPAPPAPPAPPVTAYVRWVTEDVAYIITDDERAAFKRLQSDAERDHFIEQFWLRRDPTPDTPRNEFKEEHYRRIAYANENFASGVPGWKTDRGRIYITYGPPDAKKNQASTFGPHASVTEQWLYYYLDGVRKNVWIDFVDSDGTGEYRMTTDPAAIALLRSNVDLPKAGATVEMTEPDTVRISIPLTAYGDHLVTVNGRVAGKGLEKFLFKASVQGPVPVFTQNLKLAKGTYTLKIDVKDMVTGKLAADTIEFEVK